MDIIQLAIDGKNESEIERVRAQIQAHGSVIYQASQQKGFIEKIDLVSGSVELGIWRDGKFVPSS